jgi:hypothetical protein
MLVYTYQLGYESTMHIKILQCVIVHLNLKGFTFYTPCIIRNTYKIKATWEYKLNFVCLFLIFTSLAFVNVLLDNGTNILKVIFYICHQKLNNKRPGFPANTVSSVF